MDRILMLYLLPRRNCSCFGDSDSSFAFLPCILPLHYKDQTLFLSYLCCYHLLFSRLLLQYFLLQSSLVFFLVPAVAVDYRIGVFRIHQDLLLTPVAVLLVSKLVVVPFAFVLKLSQYLLVGHLFHSLLLELFNLLTCFVYLAFYFILLVGFDIQPVRSLLLEVLLHVLIRLMRCSVPVDYPVGLQLYLISSSILMQFLLLHLQV